MLARMVDNVARPEPADAVRRAVEHIISDIVDHERDGEPIPLIADVEEAELPHPEGERDHQPAREHARDRAAQPERERGQRVARRSEEHTSELQSLMSISYAIFCLKKKQINNETN